MDRKAIPGAINGSAVSQPLMRRHNLSLALRTIRDVGRITRTELAAALELSKPAITRIVGDLAEAGYVAETVEDRPAKGRGRPSSYLELRSGRHYFVGVDFRVDRLAVQARDLTGTLLYDRHFPVARAAPAGEVIGALAGRIRALASEIGGPAAGIGLSLPARLDDAATTVLDTTYLQWRNVSFPALLRRAVGPGCPDILMSDVSGCAAIANWREISGTDATDLAHVQVGIGAGVGFAGRDDPTGRRGRRLFQRFGHLPMERGGPQCQCGAHGCLDAVAGFEALVRYAGPCGLPVAEGAGAISDFCAGLLARQRGGSADAARAIVTAAEWFGRATAVVLNMVSPSRLTLGGYPLYLGDAFLVPYLEAIEPFAPGGAALFTPTPLGDEASVVGAVLLGMRTVMSDPLKAAIASG